jgi:hypothetical protein
MMPSSVPDTSYRNNRGGQIGYKFHTFCRRSCQAGTWWKKSRKVPLLKRTSAMFGTAAFKKSINGIDGVNDVVARGVMVIFNLFRLPLFELAAFIFCSLKLP